MAGLTAFVWNGSSFYGVRSALGVAEAGAFPVAVLYLTWWFPAAYRSRMMALFYSTSVAALFIGPPIGSGLLLSHGWRGGIARLAVAVPDRDSTIDHHGRGVVATPDRSTHSGGVAELRTAEVAQRAPGRRAGTD
jgi:hypothetical protein